MVNSVALRTEMTPSITDSLGTNKALHDLLCNDGPRKPSRPQPDPDHLDVQRWRPKPLLAFLFSVSLKLLEALWKYLASRISVLPCVAALRIKLLPVFTSALPPAVASWGG